MTKKQPNGFPNIPKGMTEQELVKAIDEVVKTTIRSTMVFPGYDLSDLRQEARFECLRALEKYDESRPLVNFLRVHVKNRYLTLRRDKYERKGDSENHPKKMLASPIDIEIVNHDGEENISLLNDDDYSLDKKQLLERIDTDLDVSLRHDFLRLRNGEEISRSRKLKVLEAIKNIIWKTNRAN